MKKKTVTRKSKDPVKLAKQKATQFKKGNKKSVGFGRPPMSEAEKELSLTTRTQFKTIINKYMVHSKAELNKIYRAKDTPALDCMIIKSIQRALENGDTTHINWFANHVLGKEQETTNINLTGGMENTNSIDVKDLTPKELLALKELAEKKKSNA